MSEKKVVCFSSLSHIFLFFGFAGDSGKKWISLRKLVLCLATLQGISQVHVSQARTSHDTESLETLCFHFLSVLNLLRREWVVPNPCFWE